MFHVIRLSPPAPVVNSWEIRDLTCVWGFSERTCQVLAVRWEGACRYTVLCCHSVRRRLWPLELGDVCYFLEFGLIEMFDFPEQSRLLQLTDCGVVGA